MLIGIDASRAFGPERTGTENYSYHVITNMLRLPEAREHQFVLFVRPNTEIPLWSEVIGVKQRIVSWPDNVQIRVIPWRYLWTQLGLALASWSIKPSLDLLWIPAHTLPVLRRRGLKTVVTIHGLEYEWLPEYKNWLQKWYLPLSTKYAVSSATKLISVSQFTKDQLVLRLKANSKGIKVIHEGVDFGNPAGQQVSRSASQKGRFFSMSSRMKVLNKWKLKDKGYILFVGTIQPRKNLVFLIEAYAQLPLRLRKQSKLVIAGSSGWMSEEVYSAPGRIGVERDVVFAGRVSDADLEILYSSALIYVQPSITEGFGLPVLEAMSRGVPVISSGGGALPEVVGEAGMILKVTSNKYQYQIGNNQKQERTSESKYLQEWVEGMARMLTEPRLRERLSAAGKWRVRAMGWEKTAKETLQYLIS